MEMGNKPEQIAIVEDIDDEDIEIYNNDDSFDSD